MGCSHIRNDRCSQGAARPAIRVRPPGVIRRTYRIARAPDGPDAVTRGSRVAQYAPDLASLHIDDLRVGRLFLTVQVIEHLLFAHHASRLEKQQLHQFMLFVRQSKRASMQGKTSLREW